MLIAAILCFVAEIVFYIVGVTSFAIDMVEASSVGALSIISVIILFGCAIAEIPLLVCGIRGIKDRSIRGRSIATTAVAGVAAMTGLILALALCIYLGLFGFATSMMSSIDSSITTY